MHQRFLLSSLLVGLSINLITACSSTQAQPPQSNGFNLETWPNRCQQLKKELAKQPGTNLVYQSQPEANNIRSSWQLAWLGKRIPIPAIQYSEVIVLNNRPQDYLTVLQGTVNGQKLKVFLAQRSDQYRIDDIFSTASTNGTSQTTPEGQALTKQLFGGPVTPSQLISLGYNHKVSDLTCTKAQWEKEVPISLSLSLKTVGDIHIPTSAYRLDQGYITYSQTDKKETWAARWDDQRHSKEIIFQLPNGHTYGKLGLGIGQPNWQSAPVIPKWLTALETALNTPTKSNWQSLAQAMKAAGMPKKSIDSVQKIINAN